MTFPTDTHHRHNGPQTYRSSSRHDDSASASSRRTTNPPPHHGHHSPNHSSHTSYPSPSFSQLLHTPMIDPSSSTQSQLSEVPPEALVRIPQHVFLSSHLKLFGNKLVLVFESELNTRQVLDWLAEFNEDNHINLSLSDELQHPFFVVQFDSSLGESTRQRLIKRSPLKACGRYAAVNTYGPQFNPGTQREFRHLITVHINQGSPQIYKLLNLVLAPLGRLIRSKLAPGVDSHRISAIVETTLTSFPSKVRLQLPDSRSTAVTLDFAGKNLRCFRCFSYRHSIDACTLSGYPTRGIQLPDFRTGLTRISALSRELPSGHLHDSLLQLRAQADKATEEARYWQEYALKLKGKNPTQRHRKHQTPTTSDSSRPNSRFSAPLPPRPPRDLASPPHLSPAKSTPSAHQHSTPAIPNPPQKIPTPSTATANTRSLSSQRTPTPTRWVPKVPQPIPELPHAPQPPQNFSPIPEPTPLPIPPLSENITLRKRGRKPSPSSSATDTDPETLNHNPN